MGKRIGLFLLTNFLVVIMVSIIGTVVISYFPQWNVNLLFLAGFSLVWGFTGSIISLLSSKFIAKKMYHMHIIKFNDPGRGYQELRMMVEDLAKKAGLKKIPEIGIYHSDEINAFATGPSKNNSLIAFSSGLINSMNKDQIQGVASHEIAHIANGDMVTMTLLQGVVNSFVIFLSRVLAGAILKTDEDGPRGFSFIFYFALVSILEVLFMLLGSIVIAYFSRWREYRADEDGANLGGREQMIQALERLIEVSSYNKQHTDKKLTNFKIFGTSSLLNFLFSTHPPLDKRVRRLLNS